MTPRGCLPCSGGNIELRLEDGSSMRFCARELQQATTVLRDALACSEQAAAGQGSARAAASRDAVAQNEAVHKLPLPGSSREQVLLLLGCLHEQSRECFIAQQSPPLLEELAKIADKLGCTAICALVDRTLVSACKKWGVYGCGSPAPMPGDWLNVWDAAAQLMMARRLRLTAFECRVGRFIGEHVDDVDWRLLDPATQALLAGAQAHARTVRIERDAAAAYKRARYYEDSYC